MHALAAIIKLHTDNLAIPPKATFTVNLVEAKPPEPVAMVIPPSPPAKPPPVKPPPPKPKVQAQAVANTPPPVQAAAKVESPTTVAPVVTQETSPITAAITPAEQKTEAPSKPASTEPAPAPVDTQRTHYGALLAQEIAKYKQYPVLAKKTKQQGNVVLQIQITSLGKLINVQVYQSSGFELLDNQAMDMVKKATPFSQPPSSLGDRDITLLVPVSFRLN